jgi:acyl-CoA reductase-like NAD-dependent aldehyde dehydrogenase
MTVQIQESQIETIIQQILAQLNGSAQGELPRAAQYRGVFRTADEAVKAARLAADCFSRVSLTQRKAIIQAMRDIAIELSLIHI